MEAENVELVGAVKNVNYPFQPRKRYEDEFPRKYPHFRAKLNDFASMLRIRSSLSQKIHQHFHQNGYIQIDAPILTSNDCEGAGEQFKVIPANDKIALKMQKRPDQNLDLTYFDRLAYLTVSSQLHLEAICNGIEKVYTFNSAFRAEMGRTTRHLSEFSMIEAEVGFLYSIEDLLQIQENLIKKSVEGLLESNQEEVEHYLKLNDLKYKTKMADLDHLHKILRSNFVIMTYKEAFEALDRVKKKFQTQPDQSKGLGKEHEIYLVEDYCDQVPVFVIDWPKETKAFYCRRKPSNNTLVSACDLLFPKVGELSGGSLRENDYDTLQKNIDNLNITGLDWYLDLRQSGASPTGGFGVGFERLLQFILKANNIRDTIPFPRRPHDCRL